jgi:CRP-like cAMP-binding protein
MLEDLRRYAPFSDLPEEDLALAAPLFCLLEAPAGTTLFRQDEAAHSFYLVISGQVALRYKPYDGPELGLTRIGAGGAVGWSAVMGNRVYTATAVASTPCEFLTATGADLQTVVHEHPVAGQRLLGRLALAVSPRWTGAQQQVLSLLARGTWERTS